jgi:hypothetical protein
MKTQRMHPEASEVLDAITDDDKAWFQGHPKAIVRFRPQFPDELELLSAHCPGGGLPLSLVGDEMPTPWLALVDAFRADGIFREPYRGLRFKFLCPELPTEGAQRAFEPVVVAFFNEAFRGKQKPKPRGFG